MFGDKDFDPELFDWYDLEKHTRSVTSFNQSEWGFLYDKMINWNTCPTKTVICPRLPNGEPLNPYINRLGEDILDKVNQRDFKGFVIILKKILNYGK